MQAVLSNPKDNIILFETAAGAGICICNSIPGDFTNGAERYGELDIVVDLELGSNTFIVPATRCGARVEGEMNYLTLLVEMIDKINDFYQVALRLTGDCVILGELPEIGDISVGDYLLVKVRVWDMEITI